MRSRSRIICLCAVYASCGLLVSYLESFFVLPVRIPGIRLGLANIVTLIALYTIGPVCALLVLTVRVILSAMLFGSFSSFLYSFSGAILAYTGMILCKKLGFSVYSVSVTGAVFHNTAQIAVAYILISTGYVFMYMPVLVLAGTIFGVITGFLSDILIGRLRRITYIDESEGVR